MHDYTTSAEEMQYLDSLYDENFEWQEKKRKTLRLDDILQKAGYDAYALRAKHCATHIEFLETGDRKKKRVKSANYCNLRLCPLCTSRKSWKAAHQLSASLNQCEKDHMGCQFLFLTLTMRNVGFGELDKALKQLLDGWSKLRRHRPVARAVKGWFRAVEITYDRTKGFHPHIHAILVVEDDYFKTSNGLYITQPEWVQHWKTALQVDYNPIVGIQRTHSGSKGHRKLVNSAVEAAKYAVKDSEYISGKLPIDEAAAVVKEYLNALHRKRLTAYGGWLKEVDVEEEFTDAIWELLTLYKWSFGVGDYLLDYYEVVDPDDVKNGKI